MEESGLRRPGLSIGILFLFLLILAVNAGALELTVSGGGGNFSYDLDRENSLGAAGEAFESKGYGYGLVGLKGDFSDLVGFSIALERDSIMRNRFVTNADIRLGRLKLEVGPFVGIFNDARQPLNAGISAGMGVEIPGILFGSIKAGSTIGALASQAGENLQQTSDISIGFWVPHVVCTLSMNGKSFTNRANELLMTKDERIRYQFQADVFGKNIPYTIQVNIGYQSLKRSYMPQGSAAIVDDGTFSGIFVSVPSETDELRSVYFGFEATYRIVPQIQVMLGAEMPIYSWSKEPMQSPNREKAFFELNAGIVWTLPEKSK
jgi:hypothetical protein